MIRTLTSIFARERGGLFSDKLTEHYLLARSVFLVAVPMGILVGAAIAGYDFIVNEILWKHCSNALAPMTLCLMPIIAMTLTGVILSLFRVKSSSMADEVVRAYHRPDQQIDYKAALPKLAASIATIGLGASAGMEGASKWLGGTITSFLQRQINKHPKLRWFHVRTETMLMVGAAAGIAAIFRAPLTGAIMGIESPYKRDLAHEALIPGLVASATSYATFCSMRPSTPYFPISFVYHIHLRDLLLCVPVGILGGLASHLFLELLSKTKKLNAHWQAPRVLKCALGGVMLSVLAWLTLQAVGTPATLQSGLPTANALLAGRYLFGACVLLFAAKMLATVITFGMGGVGGLFVPSATMGAALGAACDLAFHPSQPGLFTLIGIAAFTGASYNSLLFAAVFVAEATGSPALVVPSLIASSVAFLVAAGISNSESQRVHRSTDEAQLSALPCGKWMATEFVVVSPKESLQVFHDRTVLEQNLLEMPVANKDGALLGIASVKALRTIPSEQWSELTVMEIVDRKITRHNPHHSMRAIEQELAHGVHDCVPIVDAISERLIGILTAKDLLRARTFVSEQQKRA